MVNRLLTHGVSLKAVVFFPVGEEQGNFTVGRSGITSITVLEENGPMATIPWARVEREGQSPILVNLLMVESVVLDEEAA